MESQPTNYMQWVNLFAIFAGPVFAVLVTRFIDGRRDRNARRMLVFREMMRNRRMVLSPDYVGALNLVEIEFHGERSVETAWKNLLKHFAVDLPDDREKIATWNAEVRDLTTRLLHAMGKSLRLNIEQLDIMGGGYAPRAWEENETEHLLLRKFMLEVLRGDRQLPIVVQGAGDTAEVAALRKRLLQALGDDGLRVSVRPEKGTARQWL